MVDRSAHGLENNLVVGNSWCWLATKLEPLEPENCFLKLSHRLCFSDRLLDVCALLFLL